MTAQMRNTFKTYAPLALKVDLVEGSLNYTTTDKKITVNKWWAECKNQVLSNLFQSFKRHNCRESIILRWNDVLVYIGDVEELAHRKTLRPVSLKSFHITPELIDYAINRATTSPMTTRWGCMRVMDLKRRYPREVLAMADEKITRPLTKELVLINDLKWKKITEYMEKDYAEE